MRLRLTAHSITELPRDPRGMAETSGPLDQRTATLAGCYERIAELVGRPHHHDVPAPPAPLLDSAASAHASSASHYRIWLSEHLDHLSEHVAELVPPAVRVAEARRNPWWR
jgi:hypothetical protein